MAKSLDARRFHLDLLFGQDEMPLLLRNKRYRSFIRILMVDEVTGRESSALAVGRRLVPGFFQSGDPLVNLLELLLEVQDALDVITIVVSLAA